MERQRVRRARFDLNVLRILSGRAQMRYRGLIAVILDAKLAPSALKPGGLSSLSRCLLTVESVHGDEQLMPRVIAHAE